MNTHEQNILQQGETENKVMQDERFAGLLIVSVIENSNHTSEPSKLYPMDYVFCRNNHIVLNITKQEPELFKSEQKVVTLRVSTLGIHGKFQMQTLDIQEIINLSTHIT